MFKNFSISVFMLLSVFSYGQKSTLLQNINFRAKELKHSLNKSGDSLILESEKTIYNVEIFNQNFEKTIAVKSNKTIIPLNGTPLGRLVVQAKLVDKRIIMTLLRHEFIDDNLEKKTKPKPRLKIANVPNLKVSYNFNNETIRVKSILSTQKGFDIKPKAKALKPELQMASLEQDEISESIVIENKKEELKTRPRTSLTHMLNWKPKKATKENNKFYWIAEEINNGNNSYKTMKLVRGDVALNLISKNKIESKTNFGKQNRLTVWEIYNTKKFMKEQIDNPEYINSSSSDLFNVVPYFITVNTTDNTSIP